MTAATDAQVRQAIAGAGLVIERTNRLDPGSFPSTIPRWRWPAGGNSDGEFFEGDWYPTGETGASPLVGQLVGVRWDSVPPLTGLLPLAPGEGAWVALTARRNRRGTARAVLVGTDSAGTRELTTAATGMWRWAFRGGAAREAFRTVIAAGIDWLLASGASPSVVPLVAEGHTQRGIPAAFRWRGSPAPDSVVVQVQKAGVHFTEILRFDEDNLAHVSIDTGTYRWSSGEIGASGLVVVETYSDEFHLGSVFEVEGQSDGGYVVAERFVRQRWWIFVLAIIAFAAEWGWRLRRGLP